MLLALTGRGMERDAAYRAVQRSAMAVWQENRDFLAQLQADGEVRTWLGETDLEALFDLDHHTRHVDAIFERVFGPSPEIERQG